MFIQTSIEIFVFSLNLVLISTNDNWIIVSILAIVTLKSFIIYSRGRKLIETYAILVALNGYKHHKFKFVFDVWIVIIAIAAEPFHSQTNYHCLTFLQQFQHLAFNLIRKKIYGIRKHTYKKEKERNNKSHSEVSRLF